MLVKSGTMERKESAMEPSALEAALNALLAEPMDHALERERTAFDVLAGPCAEQLVLFGAGNLGRRTLAGLRRVGLEPLAFADNNEALWGRAVDGVQVLSLPEAVERFGARAAFVVTIWRGEGHTHMGEWVRHLETLGCPRAIPFAFLYWKYPDTFLPHYSMGLPHQVLEARDDVLAAFRLQADEASRLEFLAQIRWRLLADFDGLPYPVAHEIYFPADLFALGPDETFVDFGAYNGDTIRAFLVQCGGAFSSIDAFEPDPSNFRDLEAFRASLAPSAAGRIRLHQAATLQRTGTVRFDAQGTDASHVGSGGLEVACLALDQVLEGRRPTFVKMDIEGAELEALEGASATLRAFQPVLAVCAYHKPDHVWKVPLLIHALAPGYRFHLRPHLMESWDLVCYAVPGARGAGGLPES